MEIKDSGERREFSSGAVRDIADGKGRCDLLPLDVIAKLFQEEPDIGAILMLINNYIHTGKTVFLELAILRFCKHLDVDVPTTILEVSKHFADGARKYAARNWEKGIPLHCYIDSGVRHVLKFVRGDNDERHDRAFVWNLLCAIWTQKHLPEMIDLPFAQEDNKNAKTN